MRAARMPRWKGEKMRTLGRIIGTASLLAIMFFGSALDSPSWVPVIGTILGMAGMVTTAMIAGLLI